MSTGAAELLQDTGGTVAGGGRHRNGRSPPARRCALLAAAAERQGRARRARLHRPADLRRDLRQPDHQALRGAPAERADSTSLDSFGSAAGPAHGYIWGPTASAATSSAARSTARRSRSRSRFIATGLIVADRRDARHGRRLLPRRGRHGRCRARWTSCSPSRCSCWRWASARPARSAGLHPAELRSGRDLSSPRPWSCVIPVIGRRPSRRLRGRAGLQRDLRPATGRCAWRRARAHPRRPRLRAAAAVDRRRSSSRACRS